MQFIFIKFDGCCFSLSVSLSLYFSRLAHLRPYDQCPLEAMLLSIPSRSSFTMKKKITISNNQHISNWVKKAFCLRSSLLAYPYNSLQTSDISVPGNPKEKSISIVLHLPLIKTVHFLIDYQAHWFHKCI